MHVLRLVYVVRRLVGGIVRVAEDIRPPLAVREEVRRDHSPSARKSVASANVRGSRLEIPAAYHAPSLAFRATAANVSGDPPSPTVASHTTGVCAMNERHSVFRSYLVGASQSICSGASYNAIIAIWRQRVPIDPGFVASPLYSPMR